MGGAAESPRWGGWRKAQGSGWCLGLGPSHSDYLSTQLIAAALSPPRLPSLSQPLAAGPGGRHPGRLASTAHTDAAEGGQGE